MEKLFKGVAVVLVTFLFAALIINMTPWGRYLWNTREETIQKIDDATNYETKKKVEDSCRAMVASYTADKLTWEQYKDSESAEQRGWADQAKMRANSTAARYNEYVLTNSYVWDGNVPKDINSELPYLQ